MVSEFEKFVVKAMINFYNFDYDMFLEYLDDNVIWYGPRDGQVVVGKDNLVRLLDRDPQNRYHCTVENVSTRMISCTNNYYLVLISLTLHSRHDESTVVTYKQRFVISGQRCRDRDGKIFWRCPFIQVSNLLPPSRGITRPAGTEPHRTDAPSSQIDSHARIALPVDGHSAVYIRDDSIRYIVGGKGIMCYVYTVDNCYGVHRLLKDMEAVLPEYYYRCHSSYIVNLRHVLSLSSHKITLDDGTEIPIASKRYSMIREDISAFMSGIPAPERKNNES